MPATGQRLRRAALILAAGLTALVVASPWGFHRLGMILELGAAHVDPASTRSLGDPSFVGGVLYVAAAAGRIAGWPVVCVVLVTLPQLIRRRESRVASLVALVLGGLLLSSVVVGRDARYVLPLVPAMAILAVIGARRLPRAWGTWTVGLLLLLTVGPTRLCTGFPPSMKAPWVGQLLELAYVRGPEPDPLAQYAPSLARTLPDAGLLVVDQDPMAIRLASHLVSMAPNLELCLRRVGPYAICRRGARQRVLLLTLEAQHDLPLLRHELVPFLEREVRLYEVPRGAVVRWTEAD